MEPINHYEVLASIEVKGTLYDAGAVVELTPTEAQAFVEAGQLKLQEGAPAPETPAAPATAAPATPEAPVAAPVAPAATPSAPAAPTPAPAPAPVAEVKKEGGWVGNHTVGEQPRKGGSLTDKHPDIGGKK